MAKASWSTSPASRTMRLRSPPITRRVNAGPARVIRLVMDPAMFDSIRQGFGNNIREGALGARVLPQQRRDDARRYVYAALHWCTNHYAEICDSVRELMGAGVFQMPADVSVLNNVWTRDAFETYWSVPGQSAEERMKLFKLAWDLLGSDFAGRHLQYEVLRWAGVCDEQLQLSRGTMEGVDRNGRPPDGELRCAGRRVIGIENRCGV